MIVAKDRRELIRYLGQKFSLWNTIDLTTREVSMTRVMVAGAIWWQCPPKFCCVQKLFTETSIKTKILPPMILRPFKPEKLATGLSVSDFDAKRCLWRSEQSFRPPQTDDVASAVNSRGGGKYFDVKRTTWFTASGSTKRQDMLEILREARPPCASGLHLQTSVTSNGNYSQHRSLRSCNASCSAPWSSWKALWKLIFSRERKNVSNTWVRGASQWLSPSCLLIAETWIVFAIPLAHKMKSHQDQLISRLKQTNL